MHARRRLGKTDIEISPVVLGCWPISGMTSIDVNDAASRATLVASLEVGVNTFDTAYAYGIAGESERLIAELAKGRREQLVICTKGGIAWNDRRQRIVDGRPETLRRQCDESLQRLETDYVDLLYLHAPDPDVPLAESAGALRDLLQAGKTRSVGVSNFSLPQLQEFQQVCPLAAFQPPYNMLQRQIERDSLPWCIEHEVSVLVYWPLMKGLLAGKLTRNHVFAPGDGRAKYPMFQGDEWKKNQDFVDQLRAIAEEEGRTVADVVVNWTIHQPGITAALCGAKRPEQIRETAAAMQWTLSLAQRERIERAIAERGEPITRGAV